MSENKKTPKLELLTDRILASSVFEHPGLEKFQSVRFGLLCTKPNVFVQFSAFLWISDVPKRLKSEPLGIEPKVDRPKSKCVRTLTE